MLCELVLSGVGAAFWCEVPELDVFKNFDTTKGVLSWSRGDVIAYGGGIVEVLHLRFLLLNVISDFLRLWQVLWNRVFWHLLLGVLLLGRRSVICYLPIPC
jgi:hypothetical protein